MLSVKIGSDIVEDARELGIFRSVIKKALENPDAVEELKQELPAPPPPAPWPVFTFYLKTLTLSGSDNGYLLVQVVERDVKRVVTKEATAVWRIYPSDLGLNEIGSPLETFRAFVATYGVNLGMRHEFRKLFLHQIIAPTISAENNVTTYGFAFPQNVLEPGDRRVSETPQVRVRNWMKPVDHMLCLAMAYAINLSNYKQDLQAHGVQTKP